MISLFLFLFSNPFPPLLEVARDSRFIVLDWCLQEDVKVILNCL